MAANDLTEFHKKQLKENTGHWTIRKTLPGLMNPGSCCFMLIGGRGYRENHMSTCIHFICVNMQATGGGVMAWGVFSLHTMGLIITVE
jgi:hypothetical protein